MSNNLIEEIKQDLSKEKYLRFWLKYRSYIILFPIIILLSLILFLIYQDTQKKNFLKDSIKFSNAYNNLNEERFDQSLLIFSDIITNQKSNYQILSHFYQARIFLNLGDYESAIAALKNIEQNKKLDSIFQELTSLEITRIMISLFNHDDPLNHSGEIETRLAILTKENSIFYFSGLKLQADYHIILNEFDEAENSLNLILQDNKASTELNIYAEYLLQVIKS